MNWVDFEEYIKGMKFYRDKYVAHLDDELGGRYPHLATGKDAVKYLYDYLLEHEDEGSFFPDAAGTANDFLRDRQNEGRAAYE